MSDLSAGHSDPDFEAGPARSAANGITVVVTVRDDREQLVRLLAALAIQERPADEIVVVDGGSADGTVELLAKAEAEPVLPLTVLHAHGANIAAGRNIGIAAAAHELIAVTDAGCRPQPAWLASIAAGLADADFVGGTYRVDARTPFERCLALALYPMPEEIGATDALVRLSHRLFGRAFAVELSTGRSMGFTRATWRLAGGFPEDLYAGEDVGFSSAVVGAGARARLLPAAEVAWRPRATWRANAAMYRTYARGDVRRGRQGRHLLRALGWTAAPAVALTRSRSVRALAGFAGLAYLWLPGRRALRDGLPLREWWRLPLLVAMKDLAQCAGACEGLRDAFYGRSQPTPGQR